MEDGDFRLSTRFLEHHCITTNLSEKSHNILQPSLQIFSIKTFFSKLSGGFGYWNMIHPFFLFGSAINHSLLQNPLFWFVWSHCVTHKSQFCNINSNNLMCRLPGPCCKNFCISWPFSYHSSSKLNERLSAELKSRESLSNSTKFSAFMLCFSFLFFPNSTIEISKILIFPCSSYLSLKHVKV